MHTPKALLTAPTVDTAAFFKTQVMEEEIVRFLKGLFWKWNVNI